MQLEAFLPTSKSSAQSPLVTFSQISSHLPTSTMSTLPVISQLKSAWQFITGDAEGAKETWHQFTDAWTQHPGQTIADMADSIPLIGHIKGIRPTSLCCPSAHLSAT